MINIAKRYSTFHRFRRQLLIRPTRNNSNRRWKRPSICGGFITEVWQTCILDLGPIPKRPYQSSSLNRRTQGRIENPDLKLTHETCYSAPPAGWTLSVDSGNIPTMIVTLDSKRRLTVPTAVPAKPGDHFLVDFDAEEDALMCFRIASKPNWLKVLKACPVPMDDLPPRRREYFRPKL